MLLGAIFASPACFPASCFSGWPPSRRQTLGGARISKSRERRCETVDNPGELQIDKPAARILVATRRGERNEEETIPLSRKPSLDSKFKASHLLLGWEPSSDPAIRPIGFAPPPALRKRREGKERRCRLAGNPESHADLRGANGFRQGPQ